MLALSRRLSRSAFVGLVVWAALLFVPLRAGDGLTESAAHLLLLAPLVLVPLFLEALVPHSFAERAPRLLTAASWLLLPGAVAAAAAFLVPVGPAAGALTVPWLVAAGALALWAIQSTGGHLRAGRLRPSEAVLHAGLAALPVGAVGLAAARSGVGPGPDGDLLVLLTAAHVHYGAFAAPVWSGLLGRVLADRPPSAQRVNAALGAGLVVGAWLVVAAVAASGGPSPAETVGAGVMAVSAVGTGLLGLAVAPSVRDRWAGVMIAISGGALALAAGLAVWSGLRLPAGSPEAAWMAQRHGWLVAVGFGLWGGLGWRRLRPRTAGR